MNWTKTPLGFNSSDCFCNHSSNYLFDVDTTPFKIFLVLSYKKLLCCIDPILGNTLLFLCLTEKDRVRGIISAFRASRLASRKLDIIVIQ